MLTYKFVLPYVQLQSQQQHFRGEEHNPNYDHEAFLGQEAEEFDNLTQEESQRRLGYMLLTTNLFVDELYFLALTCVIFIV